MDKYEYRLKTDHIKQVAARKDYAAASKLCDTIDWNKVRDVKMLTVVADIYTAVGRYQEAIDALIQAYDYAPIGRRIVYRLTELALEADNYEDANEYFDEFCRIAPHDQGRYILLYKMACSQHATVAEKIKILEAYKQADFDEKWAYELATLYARNHQIDKCVQLCDDIILWFGLGKYVEKALGLKARYAPLTEQQKAKAKELRTQKDNQQYEDRKAQIREIQGVPDSVREMQVDSELDAVGKVTAAAVRSIEKEAARQEAAAKNVPQFKKAPSVRVTNLDEGDKISEKEAGYAENVSGTSRKLSRLVAESRKNSVQEESADYARQMAAELKKTCAEFEAGKVKEPASEEVFETENQSSGAISYERQPTRPVLYENGNVSLEKTRTDLWPGVMLDPQTRDAIEFAAEVSAEAAADEQEPVFLESEFEYEIGEDRETYICEEDDAEEESTQAESAQEKAAEEEEYEPEEEEYELEDEEYEPEDEEYEPEDEEYESEEEEYELEEEEYEPEEEEYELEEEEYELEDEEYELEEEEYEPEEEEYESEEEEYELEEEEYESEDEEYELEEEEYEPEEEEYEPEEEEYEPEKEEYEPEKAEEPDLDEEREDKDAAEGEEKAAEAEKEFETTSEPAKIKPSVRVNPERLADVWHFSVGVSGNEDMMETVMEYVRMVGEKTERPIPAQAARVTGQKLNGKDLVQSFDKLLGKIVIVLKAADMEERVVDEFCKVLEPNDRSVLVVLADTQSRLERMFAAYPQLASIFTAQFIECRQTAAELLEYAKEYADGQDCVLDKSAELLLLERFEKTEDVSRYDKKREVEQMINCAIEDAEKKSLKHSFRNLFKVRYDKEGCLILTDKNFRV